MSVAGRFTLRIICAVVLVLTLACSSLGAVDAYADSGSAAKAESDTGGTVLSSEALFRCIVRLHPQGQMCAVNVENNGSGSGNNLVWLYNIGDSSRMYLEKADGSQDSYNISFFNGSGTYTAVNKRFAINHDDLVIRAEKLSKAVECENFQFIQNNDGTYYIYCKKYDKYWGLEDSGYGNKNKIKLVSLKDAQKWEMEIVSYALDNGKLKSIKEQYDSYNFTNSEGELVTAQNWMSKLPDKMRLSDVDIPGVHDAGTANVTTNHAAQCQQLDIYDMLNSGIRYFDIRLGPDTCIVHNTATCYYRGEIMNLGDVQTMVDQFLWENPGETVILQVKVDRGDDDAVDDAMRELEKWVKTGRVYCGDHVPMVEECRGKVVILSRLGKSNADYTLSGYGQWALDVRSWKESFLGSFGLVCGTYGYFEDYTVNSQDDYEKTGDDKTKLWTTSIFSTTQGAQAHRDAARNDRLQRHTWAVSYTSCTDFWAAKYPQEMARQQNPRLISALRNNLATGSRTFIGVVCSDFSDEMLAQLVHRHNFAVQHITIRGITADGEEPYRPVVFETTPGTSEKYLRSHYDVLKAYFSRKSDYLLHDATSIEEMLRYNSVTAYASEQEYAADKLDMATLPASGDYTLYVVLDKPVKYSAALNLAAPGCADTVSGVDGDDWSGQTPKPVFQTVKGAHYGVAEVGGDQRAYWVADSEATSALTGSLDVSPRYAYAEIEADFGYCFTSDKASVTYDTGSGTRPLSNCKATLVDAYHIQVIVQADGVSHDLKKIEGTEPTCVDPGMHEHYQCETCGKLFLSTKSNASPVSEDSLLIPATGEHTPGDPVVENQVEPTCLVDGSYDMVSRCSVCNEVLSSEHRTLPATGHVWSAGTIVEQPTCTETGALRRECEHCGTGRTEEIPALGHDWGAWTVTNPATEINAGEEARTCSHDASHVETRTIPLTDHEHVLTNVEARAATCENAGNIEYWVCSDGEKPCGLCFSDAAGENVIALSDTVITAGHEWDEGVVTTPKGCTTDGVITYTCKRDASHTRTETIPATGHFGHYENKTVQITTASCTQAEYSYDVRYCADCGDVLHSHFYKSGNSLGHDWGEPEYIWNDDNSAVIAKRTCNRDAEHPHVETEVAEVVVAVVEPATCEAPGKETLTATFKNEAFATQVKEREVSALDHGWGEWVVTTEPTCTEPGVETRTCTRDAAHTETREIEAAGHDFVAFVDDSTNTATCTQGGHVDVVSVCAICGTVEKTEQHETEARGHTWGKATYTWSEDLSQVTASHDCEVCGAHEELTVSTVSEVDIEPTCDEAGEQTYYAVFASDEPYASADAGLYAFETQEKTVEAQALGHDWGEWVVTKPATETEAGEEVRTCRHDASHVETRVIPAKGSGEAVEKATLTFDLAGGTLDGKTGIVTVKAAVGETIALPGAPVRDGYTFVCWRGSEYAAGAEYKVEGDHSFTAEWAKNPGGNGKDSSGSSSSSSSSSGRAIPATGDNLNFAAAILAAVALGALIGVAYCAARRKATRGGLGR